MKCFHLFLIIFLSIFIFGFSIYNTYLVENFDNKVGGLPLKNREKTYVLMGDSILKNNAYVADGKSVETFLMEENKKVINLAEDHAKISDILAQVNKLPVELNHPNTYIFLSAGGNNILSHYVDQNNDITDTSILQPMFGAYKNLIKSIQTRVPSANIVLLDIYYPDNLQYKPFHPIIQEWNNRIYDFAKKGKNKIYGVLKISQQLTQNDDFSFGIEPSSSGGKKIVELIISV